MPKNKVNLKNKEYNISFNDAIEGFFGIIVALAVFSMLSYNFTPNITTNGSGHQPEVVGPGGVCYSTASMKFSIINSTPWYDFTNSVNSHEIAYFNVTNCYFPSQTFNPPDTIAFPTIHGMVTRHPGGKVLSTNGPHKWNNYTSNGIKYVNFFGDIIMSNYGYNAFSHHYKTETVTNIVVAYRTSSNGGIWIRYWVQYNKVTTQSQQNWLAIKNLAKTLSESGN